jgi:hypothetical protein
MEDNNALLEYAKEYQGSIGVPQNEEALGAWINDKSNQKYIIDHMKAMNPDQYEEYDALKKKDNPEASISPLQNGKLSLPSIDKDPTPKKGPGKKVPVSAFEGKDLEGQELSLRGDPLPKKTTTSSGPEKDYRNFLDTLPENLRTEDPLYDMRYLWEQSGSPKDFKEAVAKGLFTKDPKDGLWHGGSVDPKTNRFLKHKDHPTVQKELDWYYGNTKEAKAFREEHDLDKSGEYYQYVKKESAGEDLLGETKPKSDDIKHMVVPGQTFKPYMENEMQSLNDWMISRQFQHYSEEEKPDFVKDAEARVKASQSAGPVALKQTKSPEKKIKDYDSYQRNKVINPTPTNADKYHRPKEYLVYDAFGDVQNTQKLYDYYTHSGEYNNKDHEDALDFFTSGLDEAERNQIKQSFYQIRKDNDADRFLNSPESILDLKKSNPEEYYRMLAAPYLYDKMKTSLKLETMDRKGLSRYALEIIEITDQTEKNSVRLKRLGEEIETLHKEISSVYNNDPDIAEYERLSKEFEETGNDMYAPLINELAQSINLKMEKTKEDPKFKELAHKVSSYQELYNVTGELLDKARELGDDPDTKIFTKQYFETLSKSAIASKAYLQTKHADISQQNLKQAEELSNAAHLGNTFLNASTRLIHDIYTFIPSVAHSISHTLSPRLNEQWTATDRAFNYFSNKEEGATRTVKEKPDLIDKDGNFNFLALGTSVADGIPLMLFFMATGAYAGGSSVGKQVLSTGLKETSIASTIRSTIAQRGAQTAAATSIAIYSSMYEDALSRGYTGAAAFAYALEMTGVEALSELIFDEYGALKGSSDLQIQDFILQMAGKRGGIKRYGKALAKNALGEPIEESVAAFNEIIMTGEHKTGSEWLELGLTAYILGAPLSIRGTYMTNKNIRSAAMYKAAMNPDLTYQILEKTLSQEELAKTMKEVNAYAGVLGQIPENLSEVKKSHVAMYQVQNQADRDGLLAAQRKLSEAQQKGDTEGIRAQQGYIQMYEANIKKRNSTIQTIMMDEQYEAHVNEEMVKFGEELAKEKATDEEVIEAIAENIVPLQQRKQTEFAKHKDLTVEQQEAIGTLVEEKYEVEKAFIENSKQEALATLKEESITEQPKITEQLPVEELPKEVSQMTVEEIEQEMQQIEDDKDQQKRVNQLEKEAEKREWNQVFDAKLSDVDGIVDALMEKEKTMPNGFGSYMMRADARDTKAVVGRYTNATKLTDAEVESDFIAGISGNPTTWYADGLRVRESVKEASKRGVDTQVLIEKAIDEFIKDGYSREKAESIIARRLQPLIEGSETRDTTNIKQLQGGNEQSPVTEELPIEKLPKEAETTTTTKGAVKSQEAATEQAEPKQSDKDSITKFQRMRVLLSSQIQSIQSQIDAIAKDKNFKPSINQQKGVTDESTQDEDSGKYPTESTTTDKTRANARAGMQAGETEVTAAAGATKTVAPADAGVVNEEQKKERDVKPEEIVRNETDNSKKRIQTISDALVAQKGRMKRSHEKAMMNVQYAEKYQRLKDEIKALKELEKDLPKDQRSNYEEMTNAFMTRDEKKMQEGKEKINEGLAKLAAIIEKRFGSTKNITEEEYPSIREAAVLIADGIALTTGVYGKKLWEKVKEKIKSLLPKIDKTTLESLKKEILSKYPEKTITELKAEALNDITVKHEDKTELSKVYERLKQKAVEDNEFSKALVPFEEMFEQGYAPVDMRASMDKAIKIVDELMKTEAGEQLLYRGIENGTLKGPNKSFVMAAMLAYWDGKLTDETLSDKKKAEIRENMIKMLKEFQPELVAAGQTVKAYHMMSKIINKQDAALVTEKMARVLMLKQAMDEMSNVTNMSEGQITRMFESFSRFLQGKSVEEASQILTDMADGKYKAGEEVDVAEQDIKEVADIIRDLMTKGKDLSAIKKLLSGTENILEGLSEKDIDMVRQIVELSENLGEEDVATFLAKMEEFLNQEELPKSINELIDRLSKNTGLTAAQINKLIIFLDNNMQQTRESKRIEALIDMFKKGVEFQKLGLSAEDKVFMAAVQKMFRGLNKSEIVIAIKALKNFQEESNIPLSEITGNRKRKKKYQGQGTWPKRGEVTQGTPEGADELFERLKGMTKSQRRKFIHKMLPVLHERGLLTDDKMKTIMAEALDVPVYSDAHKEAVASLVETAEKYQDAMDAHIIAATEFDESFGDDDVDKKRKSDNYFKTIKAVFKTRNAYLQAEKVMAMKLSGKKSWGTLLAFGIQGNLLTFVVSFGRNIFANVFRPFIFTPARFVETAIERMVSFVGYSIPPKYLENDTRFRNWAKRFFDRKMKANALYGWPYFLPSMMVEMRKTVKDMFSIYGVSPSELSKRDAKEVFNIARSVNKVVGSLGKIRSKIVGAPYTSRYAEKTDLKDVFATVFLLPAEASFRALAFGDKPFRSGYEEAKLREIGRLLGFKGSMLNSFVHTKAEPIAFMEKAIDKKTTPLLKVEQYKTKLEQIRKDIQRIYNISDEVFEEQVQKIGIGTWIRQVAEDYGALCTYQKRGKDRKIGNQTVNVTGIKSTITSFLEGVGSSSALETKPWARNVVNNFAKYLTNLVIPYETTLINILHETLLLGSPQYSMGVALRDFYKGDRASFSRNMGIASVGFGLRYVAYTLSALGLMRGMDDDEDKKERAYERSGDKLPAGCFNVTGTIRYFIHGRSPEYQKTDWIINLLYTGTPGVVLLANATYNEKRNYTADLWMASDMMEYGVGNIVSDHLGSTSKVILGTSFLTTISDIIDIIMGKEDSYTTKKISTNLVITGGFRPFVPATLTKAMQVARLDYMKSINEEDGWKHLRQTLKYTFGGNVEEAETRITVWGEKVPFTPKGMNKWEYAFLYTNKPYRVLEGYDSQIKLADMYEAFSEYYGKHPNHAVNINDMLPPIVMNKWSVKEFIFNQTDYEESNNEDYETVDLLSNIKMPSHIIDDYRIAVGQLRLAKMTEVLYGWDELMSDSQIRKSYAENEDAKVREDKLLIAALSSAYATAKDQATNYIVEKYKDEIIEICRKENEDFRKELMNNREILENNPFFEAKWKMKFGTITAGKEEDSSDPAIQVLRIPAINPNNQDTKDKVKDIYEKYD